MATNERQQMGTTDDRKVCAKCIYDSSIPNITFDEAGICNYCRTLERMEEEYPTGEEGKVHLTSMLDEVKRAGKGKKYDAVIGVSGGCDSSFLLHQMKEYGLRLLAVHYDNTWNSTIATENIRKVTKKLGVDLFTIVVDNREMDDIFRSFLRAGVPDIEAPNDIGIAATLYRGADKFNVKYIIEGHSFRTEGISPLGWLYMDGRYIAGVHKKFGHLPMKTFPNLPLSSFLWWMMGKGIKKIRPMYYMDYNKEEAKKLLSERYGWQWYGGHHLENRFSAFYHSYFLPVRFNIDQRPNGYSALVRSGQMTRDEALRLMQSPPEVETQIVDIFKKRLDLSEEQFDQLMNAPRRHYREFPTYKKTFERLRPFFWLMYKLDRVPKSFYIKYTSPSDI